jgi:putative spermidine/putrescine transport system permease protein
MLREIRPTSFAVLSTVFALFVLFLYGPTLTITVLSFQGPTGGLVFPLQGVSTHWFADVFRPSRSATSAAASSAR